MSFRTWFDSLKPRRSPTSVQRLRRGPPSRRPAASQLAIEPLEDRCLMAAASMASFSVSDATVIEGNNGIQYAAVSVSLSAPSAKSVQVNYSTANGTAKAGSDYNAASGTLTFAPGETSKPILVPVRGDRLAEVNENFFVNLRGAKGAKIADGQGVVTIVDDEPRITFNDKYPSVLEGNFGTTLVTLTVSLSAAYDQAVTVNFATQDGTAAADVCLADYQAASGTLSFAPGETTKTITVEVIADPYAEFADRFYVNLSSASANSVLIDHQIVVTIQDDDMVYVPDDGSWFGGPYGY